MKAKFQYPLYIHGYTRYIIRIYRLSEYTWYIRGIYLLYISSGFQMRVLGVYIYYQYAKYEACTILHIDFGVCILFCILMHICAKQYAKHSIKYAIKIVQGSYSANFANLHIEICKRCRICTQRICCGMQNNMQNMP